MTFRQRQRAAILLVTIGCCLQATAHAIDPKEGQGAPPGMVLIPGGEYTMGGFGKEARSNEFPHRRVRLDAFWIDATEVTNKEFRAFVDATAYKTTAERPIDLKTIMDQLPAGSPPPPAEFLAPGSVVFRAPTGRFNPADISAWWHWTPGANWRHPEGPESNIDNRAEHPVVHVSWEDAAAYAAWAGKQLPTEAQWEWAARGGLAEQPYVWGDQPLDDAIGSRANVWQGAFPRQDLAVDGFAGTAPVRSFAANAYGLFDMAGNVWEWCADWYRADAYAQTGEATPLENPAGPKDSWDPDEPFTPKRVQRGGSYLCHASYCLNYRPSARRGNAPDTGTSNTGFRCVRPVPAKNP